MSERWQTLSPPPAYAPPAPPRGPSTVVVLLLAFLVSLIGAGTIHLVVERVRPSAGAAPTAAPPQARVVVPDLVGLTVQGARSRAELDRFLLHVVAPAPSGTLDSARVMGQHPLPGSLIRTDDVIVVRLVTDDAAAVPTAAGLAPAGVAPARATAAAAVPVPDVAGLEVTEASRILRISGYTLGEVGEEVSNRPAGTVISQRPASGTSVAAGSPVDVVLAVSAPTLTVPELGRISGDAARTQLESLGLAAKIDSVFSPGVSSGLVVRTKPAAGEEVAPGATVLVFVAE